MNTIDYIAKGQKVQFSKKAVNINGKDYAYTGMTAIKHSSAKHLYLFKYEDSWRILPYNPDDEQKLKVLFSRIADLNAKRAKILDAANAPVHVEPPQAPRIDVKSIMETAEEAPAEETQVELVEEVPEAVKEPVEEPAPEVIEEPTEIVEEPVPEVVEEPTEIIEEPAPEVVEEPVPEVAEEPVEVPEKAPAEPTEETPEAPAEETPSEEAPAEEAKESPAEETEEQAEGIFPPEEKKAKLKKSFKVLAAIIVAFIILAVVYFFVAGTANNPTVGPNADETQQYEDIDGLIEDLQDDN